MTNATASSEHDEHPEPHRAASGLTASAEQYERWGWVTLHAGGRLLLATDGRVCAVELPAAIGFEVQSYLAIRLLAGPVIALPGTQKRWLLLAESAAETTPVYAVRLLARGGRLHCSGTLLPLPPSRLDSGPVVWHVPPSLDGPRLPPLSAVVAATRAVCPRSEIAAESEPGDPCHAADTRPSVSDPS